MDKYHEPVLLREVLVALDIHFSSWYIDATLGDGGHSLEILKKGGNIIGLDVDPEALQRAEKRFLEEGFDQNKFRLVKGNFRDLKNLIQTETTKFKGILFDLGVSSLQLESPERGFSFMKNGPLDMRMDPQLEVKALDLINGLQQRELYELFNKFGEEKYSRKLAANIASSRQIRSFETTLDLARQVERVVGRKREGIHPATRIFQALRIIVNDELNALRESLTQALEILDKDGLIVVISFHSLEDRIVKTFFKESSQMGFGRVLTKKPMIPTFEEIAKNPKSRSAKMRIFKKI